MANLDVKRGKTRESIIVAMIGLVGSGKSSVAQELAKHIGGTVIEGDAIRVCLRKHNERYERARAIAENAAIQVVRRGGNAILDSDFINPNKRASLREKARKEGIKVVFICTYADIDVMLGRMMTGPYRNNVSDFFGGAETKWRGSEQSKGAVVKLREMHRRTPQHYRWENKVGGQWTIKNPPCKVLADIDTSDPDSWKKEVEICAKKLFLL
jgi:predicted kinase